MMGDQALTFRLLPRMLEGQLAEANPQAKLAVVQLVAAGPPPSGLEIRRPFATSGQMPQEAQVQPHADFRRAARILLSDPYLSPPR